MSQAKFIEDFLSATDFQNPVEVSMDTQLEDLPEWDSLAALGVIVMSTWNTARPSPAKT